MASGGRVRDSQGRRVGVTGDTLPMPTDENPVVVWEGDCLQLLRELPAGCVDAVVTDPPYGTGRWARKHSGQGSNPSGTHRRDEWDDGSLEWLSLIPPSVPIVTFWPCVHLHRLLAAAIVLRRTKQRQLYMRKRDPMPSMTGVTQWAVEPVWLLSEEGFHIRGGEDIIDVSTPRIGRDIGATGHPNEKPLGCLRWLIEKTPEDFVILDPFAGSGTTGVAAILEGRKCILIEKEPKYAAICRRRVAEAMGRGPNQLPFDKPADLFTAAG